MRISVLIFVGSAVLCASQLSLAGNRSKQECVSFAEASKHVGTAQCVSGTVLRVEEGNNGVTFLTFCKEAQACPFTVVVFPGDRKKVGDIRQLEGQQIEIKGTVQDYDGRSEIVLRQTRQLGEGAFLLFPPVPTDYDVEKRGHYGAGKFKRPKAAKKKTARRGQPVSIEDPEEPQ